MARAVEQIWEQPLGGLVVTRRGFGRVPSGQIEIAEADHPEPTEVGTVQAQRLLRLAKSVKPPAEVLFLLCGGASALLTVPPMGVCMADVRVLFQELLSCGAAIDEINTVRKTISCCAGGRIAAAIYPARCTTLIVSDVPGDQLDLIGSGPTLGGVTGVAEALDVMRRFRVSPSSAIMTHLTSPLAEPLRRDDPQLAESRAHLVASGMTSLRAAETLARSRGFAVLNLGDALAGEAKEVAKAIAGIVRSIQSHGTPLPTPCLILSGGETSVTLLKERGRGGRNSEFLLAFAIATADLDGLYALACDTDGIDGSDDNAGAILTLDWRIRANALGISAIDLLQTHDAYGFFHALGSLVLTGPTGTNVNDFRAMLVT